MKTNLVFTIIVFSFVHFRIIHENLTIVTSSVKKFRKKYSYKITIFFRTKICVFLVRKRSIIVKFNILYIKFSI